MLVGLVALTGWWSAVPLDAPVYPVRNNGFAASVLPALIAVAVLVLVARWITKRPTPKQQRTAKPPRAAKPRPVTRTAPGRSGPPQGPPPLSPMSPTER